MRNTFIAALQDARKDYNTMVLLLDDITITEGEVPKSTFYNATHSVYMLPLVLNTGDAQLKCEVMLGAVLFSASTFFGTESVTVEAEYGDIRLFSIDKEGDYVTITREAVNAGE